MNFVEEYINKIQEGLSHIPEKLYYDVVNIFQEIHDNKNYLFVGGNGGSAAISNHLVCDCAKGPGVGRENRIRALSLSSNVPLITAISNDIGYDESLVFQLQTHLMPNDVVMLISSSGKSSNIVKAATHAKQRGHTLIGLTGFDGGYLAELADYNFHIPINNYGVIEDCHQSIMHILAQIYYQKGQYEF